MSKHNFVFILNKYVIINHDFVLVGDANVFYENDIDKKMSIHHYLSSFKKLDDLLRTLFIEESTH